MPPRDANPTPSFGGFGLSHLSEFWGPPHFSRHSEDVSHNPEFSAHSHEVSHLPLFSRHSEDVSHTRGGLVCLNSAARFDKWNRAAVR